MLIKITIASSLVCSLRGDCHNQFCSIVDSGEDKRGMRVEAGGCWRGPGEKWRTCFLAAAVGVEKEEGWDEKFKEYLGKI